MDNDISSITLRRKILTIQIAHKIVIFTRFSYPFPQYEQFLRL